MKPLDDLRQKIDTYGWALRSVVDPDPALCLAYTVGLTRHGHPEVVMTGLPPDAGTAFLNLVGSMVVEDGGRFEVGTSTPDLAPGPPLPVIEVIDTSELTAVQELYGTVSAVQIVWTDSRGNLPWGAEYANPPGSQKLLGRRPA